MSKENNGTIAREAIQCIAPDTGEKGSFLHTGDSPRTGRRVSPVFTSLVELYPWASLNGWHREHGAYIYSN